MELTDQTDRLLAALNDLNECRTQLSALRTAGEQGEAWTQAVAVFSACQDPEFAQRLVSILKYSPDDEFQKLATRLLRTIGERQLEKPAELRVARTGLISLLETGSSGRKSAATAPDENS